MVTSGNGGDRLASMLARAGVEVAFGVVSVHNLPLIDALSHQLRFVPVRHEAGAVNAADGYGRVRGGLGCAITSTGTGAGNAAGALVETLTAGMPLLHVTGQIDSKYLGAGRGFIHETKDQAGMLAAVSKRAWTVSPGHPAADTLGEAIEVALTAPRGPVSVEWPIDLQYLPCPAGTRTPTPAPGPDPDATAVEEAVAILNRARRPLVWAGGGAVGAHRELARLVEQLGAGLLTSNSGRGVLPEDHPLCVGNFAAAPDGRALLAEADALVSVGTHFRSNETGDYSVELPTDHVQIDIDPRALNRVYTAKVALHADAGAALDALAGGLGRDRVGDPAWRVRVAGAARDARTRLAEEIGPQARICAAVRTVFPAESPLVRDVTIPSSTWGNRLLPVYSPETNVFPRGGGIGQGLGMGLGAAIARPEVPTLVIAGDGGVVVHLGELYTIAQERPWLVVMVFNDEGYGVLRTTQDRAFGRRSGVDLHTPDFAALARSAGIDHVRITDAADAEAVLGSAVARRAPVMVEVMVNEIGPMTKPFTPPVRIPGS